MELFRRTLAGMLMLVVAVSVGIWVQEGLSTRCVCRLIRG